MINIFKPTNKEVVEQNYIDNLSAIAREALNSSLMLLFSKGLKFKHPISLIEEPNIKAIVKNYNKNKDFNIKEINKEAQLEFQAESKFPDFKWWRLSVNTLYNREKWLSYEWPDLDITMDEGFFSLGVWMKGKDSQLTYLPRNDAKGVIGGLGLTLFNGVYERSRKSYRASLLINSENNKTNHTLLTKHVLTQYLENIQHFSTVYKDNLE